jgi:hypothetical protein
MIAMPIISYNLADTTLAELFTAVTFGAFACAASIAAGITFNGFAKFAFVSYFLAIAAGFVSNQYFSVSDDIASLVASHVVFSVLTQTSSKLFVIKPASY